MNPSEYQDEYCGMGGGGGGGGKGKAKPGPAECRASYDKQPVGGRSQARAREAAASARGRLPAYDSDFVATVYSKEDKGTHYLQPHWRDHRWSEATRAANSTLYEPADRDPANRNNWYVYRTTAVDPMTTGPAPLAVPDVHKLRYMSNNYMTGDDWY